MANGNYTDEKEVKVIIVKCSGHTTRATNDSPLFVPCTWTLPITVTRGKQSLTDRAKCSYVNSASDKARFFLLCCFTPSNHNKSTDAFFVAQKNNTVINEAGETLTNSGSFVQMTTVWSTLRPFQWSCENRLGKKENNLKAGSKNKCKYMSFDSKVCAKGKNVWILSCIKK